MDTNKTEEMKKEFLINQFFYASWNAAFRRNLFWDIKDTLSKRNEFKKEIYNKIIKTIENYETKSAIDFNEHIENIESLSEMKVNTKTLGIGKAQKILNLMCKYCWCVGWIPEPPCCVIDSQIISKCIDKQLHKIKWTSMNMDKYNKIIEDINKQNNTPAVYELQVWKDSLNNNK